MAYYRLGEEDRATYGGPEWVEFSLDGFCDAELAELLSLEAATGLTTGEIVNLVERGGASGMRAAMWYARRCAGVDEPYDTFTPRPLRIEATPTRPDDDADPPSDGSER